MMLHLLFVEDYSFTFPLLYTTNPYLPAYNPMSFVPFKVVVVSDLAAPITLVICVSVSHVCYSTTMHENAATCTGVPNVLIYYKRLRSFEDLCIVERQSL